MSENWLPVVGYRGLYEVSDQGRVMSIRKDEVILPRMRPNKQPNYAVMMVALSKNGVRKQCNVHRLVLTAFKRRPKKGEQGCHKNGKPWDNRLDNLRWGSPRSNSNDQKLHGTANRGERQRDAVLTAVDVERVRDLRAFGHTHQAIADWIGAVQRRQVSRILDGTRWAHV